MAFMRRKQSTLNTKGGDLCGRLPYTYNVRMLLLTRPKGHRRYPLRVVLPTHRQCTRLPYRLV